jgi:plastocyanin
MRFHLQRRGLAALALLAIAVWDAGGAGNGTLRGRVDVTAALASFEAVRPSVNEVSAAPGGRRTIDRRRSVVYFEIAPRAAFDERETRARMDQRNQTFVPHVLAVTAGTVVDFPNNDRTYHNVFSLSKAKSFDLGRYAAGRSKSVAFERPGIVRVFCDIHSHMSAYVLVFGHRYYAVTDETGAYQIPNIPPGSYTVTAWHEVLASASRQVTITEGGLAELNFTLDKK